MMKSSLSIEVFEQRMDVIGYHIGLCCPMTEILIAKEKIGTNCL